MSKLCWIYKLTHFASAHQDFYIPIDKAGLVGFLKNFLSNGDPDIRAKACSAIGNMCRHSSYFYSSLVRKYIYTLISLQTEIACQANNTYLLMSGNRQQIRQSSSWLTGVLILTSAHESLHVLL